MIFRGFAAAGILVMLITLIIFLRKNMPGLAGALPNMSGRIKFLRLIAYLLVLVCFLLLAFSAIGPVATGADHLSGMLLVIHVTIAPVYLSAVAFFLLLSAHRMTFEYSELRFSEVKQISRQNIFWQKLVFWTFCSTTVLSAASIILMLFPLFGSEGQETLLDIHRISALVLIFSAAGHFWTFQPFKSMEERIASETKKGI
jgi:cytochrome b subunit of formate dehydrogenase